MFNQIKFVKEGFSKRPWLSSFLGGSAIAVILTPFFIICAQLAISGKALYSLILLGILFINNSILAIMGWFMFYHLKSHNLINQQQEKLIYAALIMATGLVGSSIGGVVLIIVIASPFFKAWIATH